MDIIDCINTRRTVRKYKAGKLPKDTINELIVLGTKAPSASAMEPWAFAVLQNKVRIDSLAAAIKRSMRESLKDNPHMKRYEAALNNESFHILHHAENMIFIFGDTRSKYFVKDCSLVQANITLAAHSIDIGSCWIGFADFICDTPEFKAELGVPEGYSLVCAMTLGFKDDQPASPVRKEPIIFSWKE